MAGQHQQWSRESMAMDIRDGEKYGSLHWSETQQRCCQLHELRWSTTASARGWGNGKRSRKKWTTNVCQPSAFTGQHRWWSVDLGHLRPEDKVIWPASSCQERFIPHCGQWIVPRAEVYATHIPRTLRTCVYTAYMRVHNIHFHTIIPVPNTPFCHSGFVYNFLLSLSGFLSIEFNMRETSSNNISFTE